MVRPILSGTVLFHVRIAGRRKIRVFLERRDCSRMKTWVLCLMSFTLLLGAAEPGLAREKKTVQKSTTDAQARGGDTYIDAGSTATNFGTADPLLVRSKTNSGQHALLLFDLSSLANVGVKAATLNLNVTSIGHNNRVYEIGRAHV